MVLCALYFSFGEKGVGVIWMLETAILLLGRWLFYRQLLTYKGWIYWSTTPLFIFSLISVILLGGLRHSTAVIIWAALPPMINITMIGILASLPFMAVYFLVLGASAILPYYFDHHSLLPQGLESFMIVLNIGGFSLFVMIVFQFFISQHLRAEAALQRAHDELELRVQARTAELAQTNADLQAEIRERQRYEEELRLHDRAMEASSVGILITDARQSDNPIIYANPAFAQITGYPHEELIGRNPRFLQGPDTDPEALAELRQAVR
jgi:PAS domain-containing protein